MTVGAAGSPGARDRRRWVGWLLVGLGLRFLLLPIGLHPDMLRVYDRIRLWDEGALQLSDFSFQALPMLLHGIWAKLTGVTLPDMTSVPWPDATLQTLYDYVVRTLDDPSILGTLMVWKAPYLVADVLCAVLLVRLVPGRRRLLTFALWMLHPTVLYVGVLFGKYEAFMIVPLLLGLRDLRRGRAELGFLWIGVAAAMRLYPAILLPPLVLAAAPDARRRIELAACALVPVVWVLAASALRHWSAWLLVPLVLYGVWRLYGLARRTRIEVVFGLLVLAALAYGFTQLGAVLANPKYSASTVLYHAKYFTRITMGSHDKDPLLVFGLAYALICLWSHRLATGRPIATPSQRYGDLVDAALLATLCFFAFSYFHPQYAMLLVPLVLLRLHRTADGFVAHGVQLLGLLCFLFAAREGSTTTWLFAPLAPYELTAVPGPRETLPIAVDELSWGGIGRTLLALGSIWMAWDILRTNLAGRAEDEVVARPTVASVALLGVGFLAWPAGLYLATITGLQTEVIQPIGVDYKAEQDWMPGQPFKQLTFGTSAWGVPDGLLVKPPTTDAVAEGRGYSITLRRVDQRRSDADVPQQLWVDEREFQPDPQGRVLLDLTKFDVVEDAYYRLDINPEKVSELPPTYVRQVQQIPSGSLTWRVRERALDRLFGAGGVGVPWAVVVGLLLAGGAGVLVVARLRPLTPAA
jgi:hypothetical protein